MNEFIDQIIKNLTNNGFPEKSVSLPTEKMYEVADNKSLSLNKVLEVMLENHQISSKVGDEKIIFSKVAASTGEESSEDMMRKAQEMLSQMDPAEIERMKNMFMNMSDEEKEEIMAKGRKMGLM